ncbi:MAG TPA: hypothetical protein VK325_05350 [Pseudoxanthomonas sp.]|nr:hypothetical protein [Pseudoxanthomonas sp.]
MGPQPGQLSSDGAREDAQAEARERAQLDEPREELAAAIRQSQALAPFKDQLLIDPTPEGLLIQIADRHNRPMFDLGRGQL